PATTPRYTLSLHDALPICPLDPRPLRPPRGRRRPLRTARQRPGGPAPHRRRGPRRAVRPGPRPRRLRLARLVGPAPRPARRALADRKSTRLNSSYVAISYA